MREIKFFILAGGKFLINSKSIMKLLNSGNSKTIKGLAHGYVTYGIHLAPSKLSGFNTCHWASKGCSMACLNTAGRGIMKNVQKARINKTKFLFQHRETFMAQLHKELTAGVKKAYKYDKTPCVRLNLTSDIPWETKPFFFEGKSIFDHFPDVTFYDYTKGSYRMNKFIDGKMPKNYSLTFSRSEETELEEIKELVSKVQNVAVVFRDKLPKTWEGMQVVDGDDTDLRFLDPKGVIVGLVEKGLAKKDETGFVVEPK